MSKVKVNIIANYAGVAWVSLFSLVLVPVYLRLLGPEAYGLVGFFVALRATIGLLDLGLSTTTTREVASRANQPRMRERVGSLVRTVEGVYWGGGMLLGTVVALLSLVGGSSWFQLDQLSTDTVHLAWVIFGMTVATSWPAALYRGVLRGLERQVFYNLALMASATIRGVGAVVVLVFISQTVTAFFVWQVLAGAFETGLLAVLTWSVLRREALAGTAKFDLGELKDIWRFMVGVSLVTVLGVSLSQADRILISRLLPLEQVGYYTVVATLALSLSRLVGPIITAVFPRFTAGLARNDGGAVFETYCRSVQLMIALLVPAAVVVAVFSRELLLVWTQMGEVASNAHLALSLLAIAQIFVSLTHISSNVQLAAGKTRFLLWLNLLSLLVFLPVLYGAVVQFGISGAAGAWLLLSVVSYGVMERAMRQEYLFARGWASMYAERIKYAGFAGLPAVASWGVVEVLQPSAIATLFIVASGLGFYYAALLIRHRGEFSDVFRRMTLKKEAIGNV